jgi:hypothetical protein
MPSDLPNLSGDMPTPQGSAWVDPYGADPYRAELGLFEAKSILTSAQDLETLGLPEGHRSHERLVAPPCRPIPIQLLQLDGSPRTEWFYADILDISQGGLCLLITESHAIAVGHGVMVDFKAHLSGDLHRVRALVRWFVRSCGVITMGLGFVEPLHDLPELQSDRRHRLRNLNEEPKT